MGLQLWNGDAVGDITSIVFRIGDAQGEEAFRVSSLDETISFTPSDCELLLPLEDLDDPSPTSLFVVIETAEHPDGAFVAPLLMWVGLPTLEGGWGTVKSAFTAPDPEETR